MQKEDVTTAVRRQLQQRLDELDQQLVDVEQARNNETKSSAGDKYETSREMIQREADQVQDRIRSTQGLLNNLTQLRIDKINTTVQEGSLVQTNKGWFFLAVPLGKIKIGTNTCFALSSKAPLGAQLLGKKKGDRFLFRESEIEIQSIQ